MKTNKYEIQKIAYNKFKLDTNPTNACFDADKIDFPFRIRKWEKADKFKPLGMKGFKKISDFLIDSKTPNILKDEVYVICSNNEICWLISMRVDDRFKITKNTKTVLYLKKTD